MAERPERLRIVAENGTSQTLASGVEQFQVLGAGAEIVVLGLGPEPGALAEILPGEGVRYVEHDAFAERMPQGWRAAIPRGWKRIPPAEAERMLDRAGAGGVRAALYRPNLRLFPSFWGPLWARGQAAALGMGGDAAPRRREVWMPAHPGGLLVRELQEAFAAEGLAVRRFEPSDFGQELPAALREGPPALVFSVNFAGLDSWGETCNLLEAAGVAVAVWCVDNPLHLLSGLRGPFWRRPLLCVTDASFTEPLMDLGARAVLHLPLAAWDGFAALAGADAEERGLADRLVFVGRSEFPDKAGFFAGLKTPREIMATALGMLERGERPDYHWWTRALASARPEGPLWPGRAAREPGLGAEQSAQAWRSRCLSAAAAAVPLTVYGDAGWNRLAAGLADRRAPVDYYGPLAAIYRQAGAVLGMTSLLLPAGLTQRHFDVWAAGGLLLSDATPGLDIFPKELVREVRFTRAEDIPGLFARFRERPGLREGVVSAWRDVILKEHTYGHRVRSVLDWVDQR